MAVELVVTERLMTFVVEGEEPVQRKFVSGESDLIVVDWLIVTYSRHVDTDGHWFVRTLEATGHRAKKDGSAGRTAASTTWWSPTETELERLPEWVTKIVAANMPSDEPTMRR